MTRRTVIFAAGLSLLLCIAVVVLFIRQRWQPWPEIGWGDSSTGTRYRLLASYGYAQFMTDSNVQALPQQAHAGSVAEVGQSWRIAGIGYGRWNDIGLGADLSTRIPGTYGYHTAFHVSLVWPLIASVLVPGWIGLRWATRPSRRRIPRGHCPSCGYDLRASREHCPECGRGEAG